MPVAMPYPAAVRLPARARERDAGLPPWTTAREALGVAWEALTVHKLRCFLTLLGVVISTTTLIVVMSVVNGMNHYIADHVANLGTNTFVLHQFQWAQGFEGSLKARRRNQPIRMEDFEFLQENLQAYQHIGALSQPASGPQTRYQSRVIDEITLNAVTPGFVDVGREKIADATSTKRTICAERGYVPLGKTWWKSSFPRLILWIKR